MKRIFAISVILPFSFMCSRDEPSRTLRPRYPAYGDSLFKTVSPYLTPDVPPKTIKERVILAPTLSHSTNTKVKVAFFRFGHNSLGFK